MSDAVNTNLALAQWVESGKVRYGRAGLVIAEPLTMDEWRQLGDNLQFIEGGVQWWLGDWLRYGEGRFGEKASQALTKRKYEYQTLANFAYVAGRFPPSRRREKLTFSHHAAVASLEPDEQDRVLDMAVAEDLSVRDTAATAGAVHYTELTRFETQGGLELIIRRRKKAGEK